MNEVLPELKRFILPGGTRLAATLHLVRTIARRCERQLLRSEDSENIEPMILQYLNRLSDYLFVAARYANHIAQVSDQPWIS